MNYSWKEKQQSNVSAFVDIELRGYVALILIEGKLVKDISPIPLNGDNTLSPLRARSLAWIRRQPSEL